MKKSVTNNIKNLSLNDQGKRFVEALKAAAYDYANGEHHRPGDKVQHKDMGQGKVVTVHPDERCPKKGCKYTVRFSDFDMGMYDNEITPIQSKYHSFKKSEEYEALVEVASEFISEGRVKDAYQIVKSGGEELVKSFHDNFLSDLAKKYNGLAKNRSMPFQHKVNYIGTEVQHTFDFGGPKIVHARMGNEIRVDLQKPEIMSQQLLGMMKSLKNDITRFYSDDGIRRSNDLKKSKPHSKTPDAKATQIVNTIPREAKHREAFTHHSSLANAHFEAHGNAEGKKKDRHAKLHMMHYAHALEHGKSMGWGKDKVLKRMDKVPAAQPSMDWKRHKHDKLVKSDISKALPQPAEKQRALGRRQKRPRRLAETHLKQMRQFLEGRIDFGRAMRRKLRD